MATRTIEISEETFARLLIAQGGTAESYDAVLGRLLPTLEGKTAGDLLRRRLNGDYPTSDDPRDALEMLAELDAEFCPEREGEP